MNQSPGIHRAASRSIDLQQRRALGRLPDNLLPYKRFLPRRQQHAVEAPRTLRQPDAPESPNVGIKWQDLRASPNASPAVALPGGELDSRDAGEAARSRQQDRALFECFKNLIQTSFYRLPDLSQPIVLC